MKITELSVERPVTTIMVFVAVILMGFISITKISRELLPSLVYPQITVITVYENATPEEIERQVTKIIEEAVGTVTNLKSLNSISREGLSLVMAEFNWSTNMDLASMDVREKIDLVKQRFPKDTQEPIVMKFNPFELPVLSVLIQKKGSEMNPETLYKMKEVAKKVIKSSLEKIQGVAALEITGGRDREIVVEVNQGRLQASGISILDVVNILKNANLAYPAGTIKKRFYEYLIRTMGEFKDIEDIRNTPLKLQYYKTRREQFQDEQKKRDKERPKGMILLKNVGKVNDTFKKQESIFRYNEQESISIAIKKQSGTNIVKVVERLRKGLKDLEFKLPKDYEVQILYDQSEYVEKSISGVTESAIMGGVLAFLVLYLFLKNIQSSLIVTISIPVSLMGTFILMYMQNISINMMSLGGLALGIGMLVDNSVVVLENISRLNEIDPTRPKQNAIEGTDEVAGAITSSTLTTITVFLPFVFVSGVAGQLFKELAYTVTFSLITSLVVAITLIPRLTSAVQYKEFTEPGWSIALRESFTSTLRVFLRYKGFYLSLLFLLFGASTFLLMTFDTEFIPVAKQTSFMIKLELPPGSPLGVTNDVTRKVEALLLSIPEVKNVTTNIGSNKGGSAQSSVSLMESNQSKLNIDLQGKTGFAEDVIPKIKRKIAAEGITADIEYITTAGVLGSAIGTSAPISIDVKGEEIEDLIHISKEVEETIGSIPSVYGVKSTFKGYRPEIRIRVNKDRASLYNISTQNVTITAQTAIKGYISTQLKEEEEEVDIRVGLREEDRANFDKIGNIIVRSPLKFDVQLNQLAQFNEEKSSSEITRKEGQRYISINANFLGASLSEVLEKISVKLAVLQRKYPEYDISQGGEREKMQESFGELMFVLIMALVFVYMIMASQFESLWQPFIVMITMPLSIIGVALALMVTGTSLNVVVLLGITMLAGIVVNNGIVLISYFNELTDESKDEDMLEMVIRASATRLRPVLMTAMTTTLGLIPMAAAGGEGSELRAPLAIAVIGGLVTSTFFTLYVVPAIYIIGENILAKYNIKWFKSLLSRVSW